jgi:FkbM family methyltransferase
VIDKPKRRPRRKLSGQSPVQIVEVVPDQAVVPYDENLLERARTQWQHGDWGSLVQLERSVLEHHPARTKLALLAAAGRLQTGELDGARLFIRLAQDWGCSKKMVSQILVACVHNSLGRARMAQGQDQTALSHFENAIDIVTPEADKKLLGEARAVRETAQQGLLPQAARLMSKQLSTAKNYVGGETNRIKILETEIELLHHELSLAQQRQQLFNLHGKPTNEPLVPGTAGWIEQLKGKSASQLGQDLWVLEKTGYKRGGYFVEFGATDGVLLSNTWLLEREFGWQGICAEPNPKLFAQLKRNRQCTLSDQYIGRETGNVVEFILADAYGASREFAGEDMHKTKRDAYLAAGHVARFTSISLDEFLREHQAPRDIDYISIDTEGSEYDLLSSFPFHEWNIRLLTVEHNFSDQRQKIRTLLEGYGYRCTEQQWDDWYEKVEC